MFLTGILFLVIYFVENDLDRVNESRVGRSGRDITLAVPWIDFFGEFDLSDAFRVKNPKRRMYSYIHTQHRAKSRLDRVYANDENCQNIFNYKHTLTPFVKAHRIVTFTIKEDVMRGPGYWKMNASVLTDRAYARIIDRMVEDVLRLGIQDAIERWLVFVETLRIETQVYTSRKRFHERRLKQIYDQRIAELEQDPGLSQSSALQGEYDYYVAKIGEWTWKQVRGHQVRIKTHPRFEAGEPNISFYSDLEKKASKKKCITELRDGSGNTVFDTEKIKEVAVDFYTDLFSVKRTTAQSTMKLLGGVNRVLSGQDRATLDRVITEEELERVVKKLQRGKSPGPDGILAEFYQLFWPNIKGMYLEFINGVRRSAFPKSRNVSITTLIYKDRGETCLLANYRPIALMNVDVKILTKLLSMRLNLVLPSIIHESQTAVYGRRIHNTVHFVRDFIDLINESDGEAALLFLDQEKAFDRVNHEVLFLVLEKFGFGREFIAWVRIVYSNASTKLNINGFLSDNVPLRSGVRQGCPLSALLYVMMIELLALRLRANPNIVGFTIGGEKIISSHYSDDAVIKITQNRCFKEVYKELQLYEDGTGARVNFEKTKGLWLGKWKGRTDDPFSGLYGDSGHAVRWTSGNVKYLGVYVGNDDPATCTFRDIVPAVKRRLNFWKPLSLPILAKARVIEIFHASKLWYAGSFYPIPGDLLRDIDGSFLDYIVFPKGKVEVARSEMEKERGYGGIKLINTWLKSVTPKVHWLINLITDENLKYHRLVFGSLVGEQRGRLRPEDVIFADRNYMSRCLDVRSGFYREAFNGISKLNVWKHVYDLREEHIFYNPIFSVTDDDSEDLMDRTLKPFRGSRILGGIRTYGELLDARVSLPQPSLRAAVGRKLDSVQHIRRNVLEHEVVGHDHKSVSFREVTQKFIYSQLVHQKSTDHLYQTKWLDRDDIGLVMWEEVWGSVHTQFFTEVVKSTVWEQIHLNFYTTHNYNMWHGSLFPCPLCRKIPEDVFHIVLDCSFTVWMWSRVEPVLLKILGLPITPEEMAFGVQPRNKREEAATVLRNWIGFSLRHHVMREERRAYHLGTYSLTHKQGFVRGFNDSMQRELCEKQLQFKFRGLETKFNSIVSAGGVISRNGDGECVWGVI